MSVPLERLRGDLDRLARRRAAVRTGTAAATLGLIVLAAFIAAFVVDFLGDLRPPARAIVFLAIAAVAVWRAAGVTRAWLAVRETTTDVALAVERQGRARDLVAALQFQSDDAPAWGSPQLERAVVGTVEESSRRLDLFDQFSWSPLPGRAALCGGVAFTVAALVLLFPSHAAAFAKRLLLADVSYPTRTVVTSLALNGTPIDVESDAPLRAPAGAPLAFTATVNGVRPASGVVSLTSDGGAETTIPLKAASRPTDDGASYTASLDAIREPLRFAVTLGDATTRARRIDLVARPGLSLDLKPTPPEYARVNAPAPPPAGVRTAYVLEGSSVAMTVHAINKPLKQVTLVVRDSAADEDAATTKIPLRGSRDGRTWTFDPTGTPLANVRRPVAFTIQAIDRDGLAPVEAPAGSIRLRADRPPRVAASAVVHRVLPTAKPELAFGASDDFGVKVIRARVDVSRGDGRTEQQTLPLSLDGAPVREFQSRHAIDLTPFSLNPGDRVTVTIEAEDARGDAPGETATAEPIAFEVTDRAGLLASLLETDEDSADRLDAIIRRELGIGEER